MIQSEGSKFFFTKNLKFRIISLIIIIETEITSMRMSDPDIEGYRKYKGVTTPQSVPGSLNGGRIFFIVIINKI